ncbi:cytochrome P450 [Nitrobacter sp.]|uniref:cytochrome P450 n=1 Tax=Nitrobacter sp. TaxID=29420 RepID=UPI0029CAB73E|nr:cytochrome P450 [Nitrobacter sp.]
MNQTTGASAGADEKVKMSMSSDPYYNDVVPDTVAPARVRDFNVYDYGGRNPFNVISELHEDGIPEMIWTRHNGGHWVAFGAEAITEIASKPELFSAVRPIVPDDQNLAEPIFLPLTSDPPAHTAYRGVVAPLFTPKHIASLEAGIRAYTNEVAQRIKAKGSCDFMEDFANEMPIVVFLRFIDLPLSDRSRLLELASAVVKPEEGHRDDPVGNLIDYLRPIIENRFANPGSDVISQIVRSEIDGRPLRPDEMLKLTMSILLGGLETVASSLGYIAHYLADHPEQRIYLRRNKDVLSGAVEELLRRFPPAVTGRQVTHNFDFRGIKVRSGDHVVWSTAMYNLDSSVFEQPMKVDFLRKRTQHSTFGVGVHFCLGAFLARLELKVFLDRWLEVNPNFHVPENAVIHHRTGLTMSYINLPLVIDPD